VPTLQFFLKLIISAANYNQVFEIKWVIQRSFILQYFILRRKIILLWTRLMLLI